MQLPKIHILNIVRKQQARQCLSSVPTSLQHHQGIKLHQRAQGILQPSFVKCILGKPQSGKSTLIQHLIKNQQFYANKFNRILYVGPTIYKKFCSQLPIIQDQHNWRSTFDIKWVFQKIKQAQEWQCKNMLIVFDDVISYMKDGSISKPTSQLFYNRRHLLKGGCISLIIGSQKWTSFPKFVRSVVTQLIIFSVNKYQCQSVWKQSSMSISKGNFSFLVSQLKHHEYIFINLKTNRLYNHKWQMM